jgi:hypothetical protein
MTRPDWIRTSYEWPPVPCGGFWIAYDDRLAYNPDALAAIKAKAGDRT